MKIRLWSLFAGGALWVAVALGESSPVALECKLLKQGEVLSGTVRTLRKLPGKALRCRIALVPENASADSPGTLQLGEYPLPESGPLTFQASLRELPERTRFVCRASIVNRSGQPLCAAEAALATPPSPAHWRNFTEGLPNGKVPAPWTRVEYRNRRVKVWGREFVFGDSPLPVQIFSQRRALLSAPARLLLDPQPASWQLVRTEQPDDTAVILHWTGKLASGKVYRARTEVCFDGVLRLDLEMPADLTVRRYALEFPVSPAVAKTLHRGPWAFGGIKTTYPVKPEPEAHPIRPQLFLFNDEIGFGWFDGMPFDWPLQEPSRALEVIPRPDAVLLRVNYLDRATRLDAARTYTAGLQPLPVRPFPEKENGLRMCYTVQYDDVDTPAWFGTVDYDGKKNFRQEQGTAEMSVRLDFDPAVHADEELFWETSHGPLRFKFGWTPKGGIFAQIYEDCVNKVYLVTGFHPRGGEWNHLAVTWGDETAIYINGRKVAQAPHRGSNRAQPAMIHAGGRNVSVDGLRISDIARREFETGRPPVADAHTLLLDNFESSGFCNGRRASFAEKIAEDDEAGYPTPDAEFGAGRWGRGIVAMKNPVRNKIEGYRHYGIDVFCFHASQYTDEAFAGMYIKEPERLRRTVREIHRTGGRAILYLNNSLSNFDRAWDAHQDDWLIKPAGPPFIQAWISDEKGYQACPRSEYIDYFFWRLAANLDEFDLDGGFLDGRMYSECANAAHGCGAVDFSGKRVAARDVWDGRLKAWRLYNLIESRGGYGEQHKSSIWDAPTCFFWDAAWEGEQLMMQQRTAGQKRTDLLPVEAMRSQINGFVYGLPSRFTAYLDQPFTAVENCTYSFVHGTTWTMTYRIHEAAVVAPYWKALDDFGANYRNFAPYWGAVPPAVSTPDPLLKVSAYVKKDRALAIVANFNEDRPRVSGVIRFQWDKLGFPGPYRAYDAFFGQEIPVGPAGEFSIDVKSFRQSWIVFETKRPER